LSTREVIADRRLPLALALCLVIAVAFWTGSRYPQLGEKATMGGEIVLEDPLGFDARLHVDAHDPLATRVMYTTVNWVNTNKKGMTFGLLFAAAFMTLLPLLRGVRPRGVVAGTALGVAIGTPLGVCVNCAAPIARGLAAAGARLETTLAAMIASPTLNIVVLTMVFSLFPLHLALLKVALTLVALLLVIPALTATVFRRERMLAVADDQAPAAVPATDTPARNWLDAGSWLLSSFLGNLWFIVRKTVPLMLLAGFLGALFVTVLPWDTLISALPHTGRGAVAIALVLTALVGLFMPVPIAFDVVISAAFLSAGVPPEYVMVLLFTLGVFSVYSFSIVWQAVSLRVAAVLSLALVVLGTAAGVAVRKYDSWDAPRQQQAIFDSLRTSPGVARPSAPLPEAAPYALLAPTLREHALTWQPPGEQPVRSRPLAPRAAGPLKFSRHYGESLGIRRVDGFSIVSKFRQPFYANWPVAAGDVHNDGWADLLFGSDRGLYLYANRGGKQFDLQELPLPGLAAMYVANAALADLDGDGWLDIFFAVYRGGSYVAFNDQGQFRPEGLRRLPDTGANLVHSVAFADLDLDGDLDIVLGNWSTGAWTEYPPEASRDAILWNEAGAFRAAPLPGVPGETLSILLSDLDGNGWPDIYIGNDFGVPDVVYMGQGKGEFRMLTPADGLVPHTGAQTMSVDSADIDNDGIDELYLGANSAGSTGLEKHLDVVDAGVACADHDDAGWRARCELRMRTRELVKRSTINWDVRRCDPVPDPADRSDCVAQHLLIRAIKLNRDKSLCDAFPPRYETYAFICRYTFEPSSPESRKLSAAGLRQLQNVNVLLKRGERGSYADRAGAMGVKIAGWTWNAKFADLDNDQWQDLYVVNGSVRADRRETNAWFQNRDGADFENRTAAVGLVDHLAAGSYAYADLDNDGDLDIVQTTFDGPVWVYYNEGGDGHAIEFELDDHAGNRFGVGARVLVRYGPGGTLRQVREIKASGGYLSGDPPRAHFGLGPHKDIAQVDVQWATGESSTYGGPFAAGRVYKLARAAGPKAQGAR